MSGANVAEWGRQGRLGHWGRRSDAMAKAASIECREALAAHQYPRAVSRASVSRPAPAAHAPAPCLPRPAWVRPPARPARPAAARGSCGHAGAAHDDDMAPCSCASARPVVDHLCLVRVGVGQFGDLQAHRQFAGEAIDDAHRAQVAQMARDRLRQDGDDAEALAQCQRSQHAAFADAQHRLLCRLTRAEQPGVAVAGDDEGAAVGVALGDQSQQRRRSRRRRRVASRCPAGPRAA